MSFAQDFMLPLHNTVHRVLSFLPRFLVAIVLFLLFLAAASLARRLARNSLSTVHAIPWAIRTLITRSIYLGIVAVGIFVALGAANLNVSTLITSLGIAGFALGFALKDIIENFISGILLLFAKPFAVDDQVTLGNFEGTVVDIQIRTTTLKTYDEQTVLIPNSNVFTEPVVNHTRLKRRRYSVPFDTSVHVDTDTVRRRTIECIRSIEGVLDNPTPFVLATSVDAGNDVFSWTAYYWAEPSRMAQINTTSDLLLRIKSDLYENGVPTPTATSATILKRTQPTTASPADGRNQQS